MSTAYLTMVALDGEGRPTPIPPLAPESADELRRAREAQLRRDNRLAERAAHRGGAGRLRGWALGTSLRAGAALGQRVGGLLRRQAVARAAVVTLVRVPSARMAERKSVGRLSRRIAR